MRGPPRDLHCTSYTVCAARIHERRPIQAVRAAPHQRGAKPRRKHLGRASELVPSGCRIPQTRLAEAAAAKPRFTPCFMDPITPSAPPPDWLSIRSAHGRISARYSATILFLRFSLIFRFFLPTFSFPLFPAALSLPVAMNTHDCPASYDCTANCMSVLRIYFSLLLGNKI